jgi:hypothetical protein
MALGIVSFGFLYATIDEALALSNGESVGYGNATLAASWSQLRNHECADCFYYSGHLQLRTTRGPQQPRFETRDHTVLGDTQPADTL